MDDISTKTKYVLRPNFRYYDQAIKSLLQK